MSRGDGEAYVFIGMLAGVGIYFSGVGQYRLKKVIEYTPTSKAVAVAPGITEITGKARTAGKTFVSPFEKKECIYYKTLVYKWSGSGKHRNRSLVKKLESGEPFYIEDDTGKVRVMPSIEGSDIGWLGEVAGLAGGIGASYKDLTVMDKKHSSTPNKISASLFGSISKRRDETLSSFLSENVPSLKNYGDTVDVEEKYFVDGDPMYVLGTAKEVDMDGKAQLMVAREKKNAFCIADGSEKSALSSVSWAAYLSLAGGPLLFAGCASILLARFGIWNGFTLNLLALSLVLMYAYVVVIHLLEMYNGMVVLKNNIDRARANVDVLLKRRHDLISNLVESVSVYSNYEKKVMGAVSKARAAAAADDSKSLVAIAEGYPQLRANENYKSLSEELANTENWIAGSRTFVMESISLYNQRIQSFPYFLFAKRAGMVPIAFESQ